MSLSQAVAAYALALIEREVYWTPAKVTIGDERAIVYGLKDNGNATLDMARADQLSIIGAIWRARQVISEDRRVSKTLDRKIDQYRKTFKLPLIYDMDYRQCIEVLTFAAQH